MSVKLSYSIKPVDVVEASASTNPDDLSIVPLRILVDRDPSAIATVFLDHINVVVRIPGQTSGAVPDSVKALVLTARPKSITPVAGQFNVWELKFDSERTAADPDVAARGVNEAVFRANPVTTGTAKTIAVVPNSTQQPFEFTLRDLEVVDHDGETVIVIEEFTRATADPVSLLTKETKDLTVQKVFPALRIERFVASPPVTTAGVAVQLSWTTKGAEGGVELEGFPRERTAIVTGPPTTGGDPVVPTGGTPTSALTVPHTGTQEVSPRVTTTYTLRASNGASAKVAAQVTVTVQDLTVAPALAIGDDSFSRSHRPAAGALQVQGNIEAQGSVTAASVDARGLVHAQTVTADGVITGGSFTTSGTLSAGAATVSSLSVTSISGNGTIPPGVVVMWSGAVSAIPAGWVLCDGLDHTVDGQGNSLGRTVTTPALLARFVVGAGGQGAQYQPADTGGADVVTLTIPNMPSSFPVTSSRISSADPEKVLVFGANDAGTVDHLFARLADGVEVSAKSLKKTSGNIDEIVRSPTQNGQNTAHENRPPFFALAYIMKV